MLESLDTPAYKVVSMGIIDTPLVSRIASKGQPIIISTGTATAAEIQVVVQACRAVGNEQVILMYCTSGYPTPPGELSTRTPPGMSDRFGTSVGMSDHTMSKSTAIIGVSLGATVIEKHFTLTRSAGQPDSVLSLEPKELAELVAVDRETEQALGAVTICLRPSARVSRSHSRSLFVVEDARAGDPVTE